MGYALERTPQEYVARMSVDEYFAFEERAERRHFYIAGKVIAMSGGTYEQSAIISNVNRRAANALEGKPCRMLESNMSVKLGPSDDYVYTDGVIVCGEPAFRPHLNKRLVLLNPTAVFEVLSDSTRDFDRTEKFEGYRQIESLQEYVLIEQDVARVDVYRRMEGGSWKMTPYATLEAVVRLESVGIELTMRQIYEDVRFGPPPLILID